jgi:N-alpha-acetyltransferase 35, NatC auxiliary subunit
MLRQVLQLGFELSIYAPDELAGMYWYLSHICQVHILHLDRVKTFTSHYSKEKEKASSKASPSSSSSAPAVEKSLSYLRKQRIHLTATSALAATLHALYILLSRHALIPTPPRPYSSDALRYELRMKPFIPITLPELVPFEDFARESACPGTSDARLLDYAARNVAEARKAWEEVLKTCRTVPPETGEDVIGAEWERDVKDVVRACIGASIAVAGVKKALAARTMDALKVEVPEAGAKGSWHVWWAVPKISQRN